MTFKTLLTLAAAALPLAGAATLGPRTGSAYKSPSTQWSLLGCVQDQYPTDRVMSGGYMADSDLTPSSCIDYCAGKLFHLAGIENGNQCYCSQQLYNGATVGPHGANLTTKNNDGCNVSSGGDSSSNGGGSNHLLVYESNVFPAPSVANVTDGFYLGCYADNVTDRLLPNYATTRPQSNDACVASCQASGYDLAGTENGSQCWCGHYMSVDLPASEPDQCNLACKGATREYCGGSGYLDVFFVTGTASTTSASTKTTKATTSTASKISSVPIRRIGITKGGYSLMPVTSLPAGSD